MPNELEILLPNGQVLACLVFIDDPLLGIIPWNGTSSGGSSGGGAATIANGADVTEGNTVDAKVLADNAGTISAKLRGINTELASIDGKTPALGQALASGSIPIVLTAAQLAALLPLTTVAITNANLDVALSTRTKPSDQQHVIVDSSSAAPATVSVTTLWSTVFSAGFLDLNVTGMATAVIQWVTESGGFNGSAYLLVSTNGVDFLPVTGHFLASNTGFNPLYKDISRYDAGLGYGPISIPVAGFTTFRVTPAAGFVGTGTIKITATPAPMDVVRNLSTIVGINGNQAGVTSARLDTNIAGTIEVYGEAAQNSYPSHPNALVIGGISVSPQPTLNTDSRAAVAQFTPRSALIVAPGIEGFPVTSSLPTGAATSALQGTGNTSLGNLDTKTPALGQALAAASSPVVLTAIQLAALTPLATVGVTNLDVALSTRTKPADQQHTIIDSSVSIAVTGPLTDTQLRAAAVPISLAIAPSTPITNANLDVALSTRLKPADTLAAVTAITNPVTVAQATAANLLATVTPIALTKSTQGATGFSVQDLRDAGRNARIFMLDAITAAPLVEALATIVQWYGNAAVAGTTQPAVVPAGKVLRLTGYKIQYQSLATVGYAVVRVRANISGLAVLASPLVTSFETGTNSGASTAAVTGAVTTETGSFPEGLELPAGTGIGFSFAGYGPTGVLTLEGGVRFEVHGYEY